MGTDIHLYVEKKMGDKWVLLKGPNPLIRRFRSWAEMCREDGKLDLAEKYEKEAKEIESGKRYQKYSPDSFDYYWYAPEVYEGWLYDNRNYDLFAILADVRNGYGFGGVKTGEGFRPIDEPRGLPDDPSEELREIVREEIDLHEDAYHDHSYLYLLELLQYDWEQTTILQGVVNEEQYLVWKKEGAPNYYSGGVHGRMVEHVDNDTMEKIIQGEMKREPEKEYYTTVQWEVTYREAVGSYWFEQLELLKSLSNTIDRSDIRIVFWFDS